MYLRHLKRHAPLYSLITLLFIIIAGLLSALPIVARQLAAANLQRSLNELHPSEKNLLITGDTIPATVGERLPAELDQLYIDTFKLSKDSTFAAPYIQRDEQLILFSAEEFDALMLHLHGFDELADHVTIIDGRLPEFSQEPNLINEHTEIIEAVVGPETAETLSIELGDIIEQRTNSHVFKIVGIVTAKTPDDPRWWGDQTMPFGQWFLISFQPDYVELNIGMLISPEDMARSYPGNVSWRVLLDSDTLNPGNAISTANRIRNLEATLSSEKVVLDSPLLDLLFQFLTDIQNGQLVLLLLGVQTLLATMVTVFLLGQLLMEQTSEELRTLSARGFTVGKLTGQFGVRYALLAFGIAGPIGILAAATILWRWPVAPAGHNVWIIPTLSWALAAGALFIAWLTLVVPIAPTIRKALANERLISNAFRTKSFLIDITLLGLGGLTIWQLRQFTAQDESPSADLLLLLGPTLIMIAGALFLRHIAPLIIRLSGRVAARGRGLLLPTALTWLGREPDRSGRLTLLVTLSTALALFAIVFTHSMNGRQAEIANYRSGASLRLAITGQEMADAKAVLGQDDRVQAMTAMFRSTAAPIISGVPAVDDVEFIALDLDGSLAINTLPTGTSDQTLGAALAPLLAKPAEAGIVPVVISRQYVVPGTRINDRTQLQIGLETITVEIRGLTDDFPTVSPPFIIANLNDVQPFIIDQPPVLDLDDQFELWMALKPNSSGQAVVQTAWPAVDPSLRILSDARALLDGMRHHLLSQQIDGMFRLNAMLLILLTAGMLTLLLLLDGWRRQSSMAVMHSLGVQARGLVRLILWEGIIQIGVGILLGALLGLTAIQLTQPLLVYTVSASTGMPESAVPIIYQWEFIGLILLGIGIFYFVIVACVSAVVARVDLIRTLRL